MNSKKLLLVTAACVLAATLVLISEEVAQAGECRLIRVWGRAEPIIEPPVLAVSKGTCVIWLNNAKAEVKVVFDEGKRCQDVSLISFLSTVISRAQSFPGKSSEASTCLMPLRFFHCWETCLCPNKSASTLLKTVLINRRASTNSMNGSPRIKG